MGDLMDGETEKDENFWRFLSECNQIELKDRQIAQN